MNHTTLLGIGIFLVLLALACCVPANGQNYYAPAYGAAGCSGMAAPMYAPGCSGMGYVQAPMYAAAGCSGAYAAAGCNGMAMASAGCAGRHTGRLTARLAHAGRCGDSR